MAAPDVPVVKTNTKAVLRLRALRKFIDEVTVILHEVEFLEDSVVDKKKFKEIVEQSLVAQRAITGLRDAIGSKSGVRVAEGYK